MEDGCHHLLGSISSSKISGQRTAQAETLERDADHMEDEAGRLDDDLRHCLWKCRVQHPVNEDSGLGREVRHMSNIVKRILQDF